MSEGCRSQKSSRIFCRISLRPISKEESGNKEWSDKKLWKILEEGRGLLLPDQMTCELKDPCHDGDYPNDRHWSNASQWEACPVDYREDECVSQVERHVPPNDEWKHKHTKRHRYISYLEQPDPIEHRHNVEDDERNTDLMTKSIHGMFVIGAVFIKMLNQRLAKHISTPRLVGVSLARANVVQLMVVLVRQESE